MQINPGRNINKERWDANFPEKYTTSKSLDASFFWLRNEYIYIIIPLNPIDYLKLERYIKSQEKYIIDNKECLCTHGHLHPLKSRMRKCIPTSLYNDLKWILEKYWDKKKSYALNSIEDYSPALENNYTVKEINNSTTFMRSFLPHSNNSVQNKFTWINFPKCIIQKNNISRKEKFNHIQQDQKYI